MEEMEEFEIKRKISFKKIFFFVLGFVLCITGILLYSRYISTSGLQVREYKVTNSKIPDSFYGFKIVHISDIHYGRTVGLSELEKMVQKVNSLKPDIVVLTGDLLDKDVVLAKNEVNKIVNVLSQLEASVGKYAISGEHDVAFTEWPTILKNSHFINLNDTYELIYKEGYQPIMIAGLSSSLENSKTAKDRIQPIEEYIASTLENEDENLPKYRILLLHEPDFITSVTTSYYDLVLAGHSHNGQVRLPFIGAVIRPNGASHYYDSHYTLHTTELFISGGVGTSYYDFRLFNRPSIHFYRLNNRY